MINFLLNKCAFSWRSKLIILFISIFTSSLSAQYRIQTIDARSGEVISKVRILDKQNTSLGLTDSLGFIDIDLKKSVTILTEHPDYKRETVVLGNEKSFSITLTPIVERVDEVVVVGYSSQKRKEMMMTEDVTNRFGDDPANGGGPLGPLQFKNANRFVFGCYNQNLPGGAPDAWMKHFDGSLDEFRIYSKALPASDVEFLYNLESEGK